MTISRFANHLDPLDRLGAEGRVSRLYRRAKRRAAHLRAADFAADIDRIRREQNITQPEARRVAMASRRLRRRVDTKLAGGAR